VGGRKPRQADSLHKQPHAASPDLFRFHLVILSILPQRLFFDISLERLPHVKRILSVAVIRHDSSVHTVAHSLIQFYRGFVALAYEKVHEPAVFFLADGFQGGGESRCMTQSARTGRDGQTGDVCVPGEVVGIIFGEDWV